MYALKDLAKLQKRSFRNKEGIFLIEGKKIISEAIESKQEFVQFIVTDSFYKDHQDFLQEHKISKNNYPIAIISDSNAERLTSSKTPAGIFAVVVKNTASLPELVEKKTLVVFETIKDPGNLGTMLRTADWFGAEGIIVSNDGVDPYNDKVLRSSMGSIFHLPVYVSNNLVHDLEMLKSKNFQIIVTRPESSNTAIKQATYAAKAIVMGNESMGTSAEIDALADVSFSIPGKGDAESLNVAVSFGIAMWEITKV